MEPTLIQTLSEDQAQQLHALYQGEWWSQGRTLEEVKRMLAGGSLVFAFCEEGSGKLLAFARLVTDGVFKAFLFDVIVHPDHRGAGLGRALMRRVVEHPEVRRARHVELYCVPERTGFYREFGFSDEMEREVVRMRRMNEGGNVTAEEALVPEEHRRLLDSRRERVATGKASIQEWDDVKHRIGKNDGAS